MWVPMLTKSTFENIVEEEKCPKNVSAYLSGHTKNAIEDDRHLVKEANRNRVGFLLTKFLPHWVLAQ